MQYKTVLGPLGMKITKNDSYDEAMKEYAAMLNREAVDGDLFTFRKSLLLKIRDVWRDVWHQ